MSKKTNKKCKVALAEFDKAINEYSLSSEPEVVKDMVSLLNHLCKKYKYATLKDHDVISDTEVEFYIDYKFNGKYLGVITIALDKMANGRWSSRVYLSIKNTVRLPMSNFTSFISEFKKLANAEKVTMSVSKNTF
jgi:hypothetical protein